MLSALLVCFLSFCVVHWVWTRHYLYPRDKSFRYLVHQLGLDSTRQVWNGLFAVMMLYLGPIVQRIIELWNGEDSVRIEISWITLRNYFVVRTAPFFGTTVY
jgi:hypothetical protein